MRLRRWNVSTTDKGKPTAVDLRLEKKKKKSARLAGWQVAWQSGQSVQAVSRDLAVRSSAISTVKKKKKKEKVE